MLTFGSSTPEHFAAKTVGLGPARPAPRLRLATATGGGGEWSEVVVGHGAELLTGDLRFGGDAAPLTGYEHERSAIPQFRQLGRVSSHCFRGESQS